MIEKLPLWYCYSYAFAAAEAICWRKGRRFLQGFSSELLEGKMVVLVYFLAVKYIKVTPLIIDPICYILVQ